MIAENVTFVDYALYDVGTRSAIIHGHEEQPFHTLFVQRVDYFAGVTVFVAEIEGEVNLVRIRGDEYGVILAVPVLKHGRSRRGGCPRPH